MRIFHMRMIVSSPSLKQSSISFDSGLLRYSKKIRLPNARGDSHVMTMLVTPKWVNTMETIYSAVMWNQPNL